MYNYGMWKPETGNQILLQRVPTMEKQQKKCNIKGNIKTFLVRDCEVKKIIWFLKDIETFEYNN